MKRLDVLPCALMPALAAPMAAKASDQTNSQAPARTERCQAEPQARSGADQKPPVNNNLTAKLDPCDGVTEAATYRRSGHDHAAARRRQDAGADQAARCRRSRRSNSRPVSRHVRARLFASRGQGTTCQLAGSKHRSLPSSAARTSGPNRPRRLQPARLLPNAQPACPCREVLARNSAGNLGLAQRRDGIDAGPHYSGRLGEADERPPRLAGGQMPGARGIAGPHGCLVDRTAPRRRPFLQKVLHLSQRCDFAFEAGTDGNCHRGVEQHVIHINLPDRIAAPSMRPGRCGSRWMQIWAQGGHNRPPSSGTGCQIRRRDGFAKVRWRAAGQKPSIN